MLRGPMINAWVRLEERVARLYDELRLPLYLYLLCMRILPKPDYMLEGGDTGALITASSGHRTHGYANSDPQMGALFIAWGVDIRQGVHLESIQNVDVAPTVAAILNLKMKGIDGRTLNEILR
jgi:hypothetical protein